MTEQEGKEEQTREEIIEELNKKLEELKQKTSTKSAMKTFDEIMEGSFSFNKFKKGIEQILKDLGIYDLFSQVHDSDLARYLNNTGKLGVRYKYYLEGDDLITEQQTALAELAKDEGRKFQPIKIATTMKNEMNKLILKSLCPKGIDRTYRKFGDRLDTKGERVFDVLIEEIRLAISQMQQPQSEESKKGGMEIPRVLNKSNLQKLKAKLG